MTKHQKQTQAPEATPLTAALQMDFARAAEQALLLRMRRQIARDKKDLAALSRWYGESVTRCAATLAENIAEIEATGGTSEPILQAVYVSDITTSDLPRRIGELCATIKAEQEALKDIESVVQERRKAEAAVAEAQAAAQVEYQAGF